MYNFNKLICLVLCMNFLSACMLGPKYRKPEMDLPTNTTQDSEYKYSLNEHWWKMFQDEDLDKLIERAFAYNTNLAIATARIEYSKASYWASRGKQMPNISAQFSPAKADSQSPYISDVSTGVLSASFELDLFGKYRALSKSAFNTWLGAKGSAEAVKLSLSGEVAKAYFNLLSLDLQIKISKRTLENRKKDFNLYSIRFKNGYINKVDLKRIEAEVYSVEATLENLLLEQQKAETSLQVLLGAEPREIVEISPKLNKSLEEIFILPNVPDYLPSSLLTRRPDIYAAEQNLISANAQISAARAEYLPDISLTASGGFASTPLNTLFRLASSFWEVSGNAIMTIFGGGKIIAKNKQANAYYEEMLQTYKGVVQSAFKDAIDSLNANKSARKVYSSYNKQTEALKITYDLTQKQQSAGLIDTTALILVEQNLLSAELALVKARQQELNALVSLAVALGGGWHIENNE